MRKTKIICTLGPATDREGILEALIREGMNVARFNFSHGTHEEQKVRLEKLKTLRKQFDKPIAALLDTKGPEVRIGCFKDKKITLEEGQEFTLVNDEVEGTQEQVTISYKESQGSQCAGRGAEDAVYQPERQRRPSVRNTGRF